MPPLSPTVTHSNGPLGDIPATPRLSMTPALLSVYTPIIVEEIAPSWWLLTIRRGIRSGDLVHAALDHVHPAAECWRLLVASIQRDPLTPEGLALIRHLYPPRRAFPTSVITAMEAMGRLAPWPHAAHP